MTVLIAGAGGQLGQELLATVPESLTAVGLARADLDITDAAAVRSAVAAHQPTVIVNAAAYTAVDRAESEVELAFGVNRGGAANLAAAAQAIGARFVHVSTDFVFDGRAERPYRPDDPTGPVNVYGASKLAGERAALAAAPDALIVRTAWVYGPGGSNFLATMLRLMRSRADVRVVADQIGTPTSTPTLAAGLWRLIGLKASGVLHLTDSGIASWYDFAVAIAEEAVAAGRLGAAPPVLPIATVDYPTPARRPAFSVLDKSAAFAALGAPAPHWRVALRAVLCRMNS
ncbi:MAG TPA: dTDP-4-dehydrorhamnose reductase [Caulobacteraceae bacterium]